MKNNKFKEIDTIFNKLKNNLLSLKNNYLKTKKVIEDYYSTHKDFFNIEFQNNIFLNENVYNNTDVNARNSSKSEMIGTNGVHPSTEG